MSYIKKITLYFSLQSEGVPSHPSDQTVALLSVPAPPAVEHVLLFFFVCVATD